MLLNLHLQYRQAKTMPTLFQTAAQTQKNASDLRYVLIKRTLGTLETFHRA